MRRRELFKATIAAVGHNVVAHIDVRE